MDDLNKLAGKILDLTSRVITFPSPQQPPERFGEDHNCGTDDELRKKVADMIEEFAHEYWLNR